MSIDIAAFQASLEAATPPTGISHALQALWYDARGDWATAHQYAQEQDDRDGAWVHAYLHRREGDDANAGYWYRRAGRPFPTQTLAEEWQTIAAALTAIR
ncbi:MAG TPA: hypothetical protein PKA05_04450 [Roseiflexaceae bacterium]|nr:hypothetical protein [Roseiflexaceae bacterium]HMP39610.1 hypothetical protein [Roseiflexaceae bacterium]